MKKVEFREFPVTELRFDDAGAKKLSGYAAVFNQYAEGLPFREKIVPGAFAKTLQNGADVRLLINHADLPLARTKSGTLALREDDKGLWFDADLDVTDPDVQRIVPKLRRKDLNQMSFGFYTVTDKWEHGKDVQPSTRTLLEVELFDVSLVTFPAYPQTSASVRSAQEIYDSYVAQQQALRDAAEIEQEQALAAHRQRYLDLQKRRV